jgi:gliding motility-associatede transport system auxiliary component
VIYPRKKVYFLTGHGEFETTGGRAVTLSEARDLTRKLALETDVLSITKAGRIPADADLLIIGGPKTPLLQEEAEQVRGYLEGGGSLLLMLGPRQELLSAGEPSAPLGLEEYLAGLGIIPRTDMVCVDYDPSVSTTGQVSVARGLTVLTSDYSSSEIVKDLDRQGLQVRFPRACPVMLEEPEDNAGLTVEEIVYMRRSAPGRPDLASYAAKLYPGRDVLTEDVRSDILDRRISIGVAAEKMVVGGEKGAVTRVVVFGDASFASSLGLSPRSSYYAPGNSSLFSNAVSWAVNREALISIEPKTLERDTVALEDDEERLARIVALWAVPGFVWLLGIAMWWWRRK